MAKSWFDFDNKPRFSKIVILLSETESKIISPTGIHLENE